MVHDPATEWASAVAVVAGALTTRALPLVSLCLALGLLTTAAARAERVPLGGRTATMGGAAVAAGNDSAMPYLNPAGLAGVPEGIFGVSATVYSYRRLSIDEYFLPTGWGATQDFGQLDVRSEAMTSSTTIEMPSSVMYFGPRGRLGGHTTYKLGVALATPEAEYRELVGAFQADLPDVNGSLEQRVGLAYRKTDYYAGPSLALGHREWLRVGISAFAYYSRLHRVETFDYNLVAGGGVSEAAVAMTRASNAESLAFVPVLGMQAKLWSRLWAGVGVAVPSVHFWGRRRGNGSVELSRPSADGQTFTERVETTAASTFRQQAPFRITAGLAWEDRERFSAAADVTYRARRHDALHYPSISDESYRASGDVTRHYTRRQDPIVADLEHSIDLSFGVEVPLGELLSVRAGGFTDFANTEPLRAGRGDDWNRLRVDQLGGSLGLGLNLGSFDTTLGMVYARGSGKMGAVDPENLDSAEQVVPVRAVQHSLFLVLSGTITAQEVKARVPEVEALPRRPNVPVKGLKDVPLSHVPQGSGPTDQPPPTTAAKIEQVVGDAQTAPLEPSPSTEVLP